MREIASNTVTTTAPDGDALVVYRLYYYKDAVRDFIQALSAVLKELKETKTSFKAVNGEVSITEFLSTFIPPTYTDSDVWRKHGFVRASVTVTPAVNGNTEADRALRTSA